MAVVEYEMLHDFFDRPSSVKDAEGARGIELVKVGSIMKTITPSHPSYCNDFICGDGDIND